MQEITLAQGGRIVIPAKVRRQLGVKEGDKLEYEVEDDVLILMTRKQSMQRAKKSFQKYFKPDPNRSVVDEFIANRQIEQAKEDAKNRP